VSNLDYKDVKLLQQQIQSSS